MMNSVHNATQELHRLLSRTSISIIVLVLVLVLVVCCSKAFHHSFPAIPYLGTKIYRTPTPERLERFCRVSEEITRLAEQSILRSLERDRYQDMCIADLQEGIENYRHMFDEHLRLVDFVHQQHVLALQKQIELEKRKRVYAENELRKVEGL